MKKLLCVLLAAMLCLSVVLTACAPAEEDNPTQSSGEETKSQGQETGSEGHDDPEPQGPEYDEEGNEFVGLTDIDGINAAAQSFEYHSGQVTAFYAIRLPLLKLPCNKDFYDELDASIKHIEHLLSLYAKYGRYFTAKTYDEGDTMEAVWGQIRKPFNAGVTNGWMKDEEGWFKLNVSAYQGDYYMSLTPEDTDKICFELLDLTVSDYKAGGVAINDAAVDALKQVIINAVDIACTNPFVTNGAKWTSETTDCECRTIEQIFYDVLCEGVKGSANDNPEAIETSNYYKNVPAEDIQASLVMIKDQYNAWAEEYEALKPYAEAYEAYVNGRN